MMHTGNLPGHEKHHRRMDKGVQLPIMTLSGEPLKKFSLTTKNIHIILAIPFTANPQL